jgi:membrane dipeptidase
VSKGGIAPELLARAEALHRAHPVVECHSDIPVDLYRRHRAGEESPLRDDYLPRLRAGGVAVQVLAVGGDVPLTHDPEGSPHLRALQTIDDVLVEAARCEELRPVETAGDLDAAIAAGQIALILHLEGLKPILGAGASRAAPLLRHFHRLGLRSAQLTWNGGNEIADGVGVERPHGLSPLGREMVAELERLGVLIDVSHLSEPSFWDLLELADGPVVATHANAFALCPHPRNLRDDQIRAVAGSGGFVGVCFVASFIGEEATLDRLLDHVDHLAALVGTDAIGVGPDYVEFALDVMVEPGSEHAYLGPEGLRRVETLPVFTAGLLSRGYSEDDAVKILGGNALRVLRRTLPSFG